MEKQEPCRIVGESMYFELKENKPHGTKDNPFCLLYTSDAADEEDSVDLGSRRIIKKKKKQQHAR